MDWDVRFFTYQGKAWANDSEWEAALAQTPIVTRSTNQIDYQWGAHGPTKVNVDRFAMVAAAKAELPAGDYLFATLSDDGVRVSIDDRRVIDNWSTHAPSTDIAAVHLTPGEHTFQIEHFDAEADASLRFRMIPAGGLGLGATANAVDQ